MFAFLDTTLHTWARKFFVHKEKFYRASRGGGGGSSNLSTRRAQGFFPALYKDSTRIGGRGGAKFELLGGGGGQILISGRDFPCAFLVLCSLCMYST